MARTTKFCRWGFFFYAWFCDIEASHGPSSDLLLRQMLHLAFLASVSIHGIGIWLFFLWLQVFLAALLLLYFLQERFFSAQGYYGT